MCVCAYTCIFVILLLCFFLFVFFLVEGADNSIMYFGQVFLHEEGIELMGNEVHCAGAY